MSSFQELVEIVKALRGPEGCPWDKAQTHESLTPYAIEEAHELEDAILKGDMDHVKEELGDLLFQSVLHAEIARQDGHFSIEDVIKNLNEKMVRRHPHVFADSQVTGPKEVVENWEDIKSKEKDENPFDIPTNFPALLRAQKIGKRSKKVKFDWNEAWQVLAKVKEELAELEEAIGHKNKEHINEELGDLLFSLAQLGRHWELDTEKALRQANEKFIGRFKAMLQLSPNFVDLPPEDKEKLWEKVKNSPS